jgi:hypothetical protein
MTLVYLNLEAEEGRKWLNAHKLNPLTKRKLEKSPRFFLERELCEWFLADKEVHTAQKLGAKPKKLSFAALTERDAPAVRDRQGSRTDERESAAYIQDEAQKCVGLWRAVLEQQAFDVLKMWGCSKEDHRSAIMFFESKAKHWREALDGVCAMALLEPEAVTAAYKAGRFKELADGAIGRERYVSRMVNKQSTTAQPDLFYSMGIR